MELAEFLVHHDRVVQSSSRLWRIRIVQYLVESPDLPLVLLQLHQTLNDAVSDAWYTRTFLVSYMDCFEEDGDRRLQFYEMLINQGTETTKLGPYRLEWRSFKLPTHVNRCKVLPHHGEPTQDNTAANKSTWTINQVWDGFFSSGGIG